MKFRQLPVPLQLFILAHLLFVGVLARGLMEAKAPASWPAVGGLLLLTVVFSTWRVELTVFQGRMTLANASVCLALLLQGPLAATLCSVVGALVSTSVHRDEKTGRMKVRRALVYRLFFNAANGACACGAGALFYAEVLARVPKNDAAVLMALTAFTAVYFLFNTVGVSIACALQQKLYWGAVWQENFLWTAPGFFAAASVAAGIYVTYSRLGAWSLVFVPVLWVIFYSYRLYMDRLHLLTETTQRDLERVKALNQLNRSIISSLAMAIDAKDRYTASHINRVQHYAVSLGEAAGLDESNMEAVATGALVHDIGKLGVPDHILGKPGKLTQEEFRRIQSHVTIGAEILSPIPFPFPVVDVVLSHHERWDGLGYPNGLRGDEIPIGGRIISLVDVFDALTSTRPYRKAMTLEEAVKTLQEGSGKQFDPDLVAKFIEILPRVRQEIAEMEAEEHSDETEAAQHPDTTSALTQISQAAAEMAAVCDVAQRLAECTRPDEVAQMIVERAMGLMPADTAVLYLISEDEQLRAVATEGKYSQKLLGMEMRMGEGVAGWVAREQQSRVNVSAALDVARRFSPEEPMELSAATSVPLQHGAQTLGSLTVYTMGYSVLSQHHLRVLNILAEHAAGALQNVRRRETHEELAFQDPLTGLPNSRGLLRHLNRMVSDAERGREEATSRFAVMMLDVDHFKQVNDTLGHLRGDDLLRDIAQQLTSVSRPEDLCSRYAGDEFVLVLSGVDRERADQVLERVREAVDTLSPVDGHVKIAASVGIACYPGDGQEGRSLLEVADHRMYMDKFRRRELAFPGLEATGRSQQPFAVSA